MSDIHRSPEITSAEFKPANPLERIKPALERMGLLKDGQYFFCTQSLDKDCDVLVLIRQADASALSLYSKPVPATDSRGDEVVLVRNQTVFQDDQACMVISSSVRRCSQNGNHAAGVEYTSVDSFEDGEDTEQYEALLDYLGVLIDSVRSTDLIDETEFHERVKDACPHGDNCA